MVAVELFPASLPVFGTVAGYQDGPQWLARLPELVAELRQRWGLTLGAPFHGGSCSWVAPVRRADGTAAVLKVTWPHPEAAGEAEALRLWAGHGCVEVYEADPERYALLLERCDPGTDLGSAPGLTAVERLRIGAGLLAEMWQAPAGRASGLARLADVCARWAGLVEERMARLRPPYDPALVAVGAELLRELPTTARREVVVHGDFNPGNVLAAQRRPWLVTDANPMLGDPAYDPWPLVEQVEGPLGLPERLELVAGVLGEPPERLRAWVVARSVEYALWSAEHGDLRGGAAAMADAKALAGTAV